MEDMTAPRGLPSATPGFAAAVALHEWFTNLVSAGFSPEHALMYLALVGVAYNRDNKDKGASEA